MANITIRHALLVLIFSAAALLIFCEISDSVKHFLLVLIAVKATGICLFAAGVYLLRKWADKLGIDDLLD